MAAVRIPSEDGFKRLTKHLGFVPAGPSFPSDNKRLTHNLPACPTAPLSMSKERPYCYCSVNKKKRSPVTAVFYSIRRTGENVQPRFMHIEIRFIPIVH
jgi:hypothetical protein